MSTTQHNTPAKDSNMSNAIDHDSLVAGQEISFITSADFAGFEDPTDDTVVSVGAGGCLVMLTDEYPLPATSIVYARGDAPPVVPREVKVKVKADKRPETTEYKAWSRLKRALKSTLAEARFGPRDLDAWNKLSLQGEPKEYLEGQLAIAEYMASMVQRHATTPEAAPEATPEAAPEAAPARRRMLDMEQTVARVQQAAAPAPRPTRRLELD